MKISVRVEIFKENNEIFYLFNLFKKGLRCALLNKMGAAIL